MAKIIINRFIVAPLSECHRVQHNILKSKNILTTKIEQFEVFRLDIIVPVQSTRQWGNARQILAIQNHQIRPSGHDFESGTAQSPDQRQPIV